MPVAPYAVPATVKIPDEGEVMINGDHPTIDHGDEERDVCPKCSGTGFVEKESPLRHLATCSCRASFVHAHA
jgi:hypothetical protein